MEENSTPQMPAAPQIPDSSPQIRDGHWVAILSMAVFVLVALGLTGFLYYQNQALKKMLANYQNVPSPTPTTTADPTANWKTYTNSLYKFSLKYPGEWEYQESQLGGTKYPSLLIAFAPQGKLPPPGTLPYTRVQITDSVDKNYFSLYQWTDVSGTIVMAGITAEQRTHKSVDMKEVVFTKGGSTYEIASENYNQNQEQNKVFDQILSTFKFLEASLAPSAKACTQEAKLCPDGSYVGRVGSNCEFAPCP